MDRALSRSIAACAIVAPTLHMLSDFLEWYAGGFTTPQLVATYLAFLPVPFMMVGLYAAQRPRIHWSGLMGAILFGVAFIYFAHTALYAMLDRPPDYETLVHKLGASYFGHGAAMVGGGLLFGVATLRARVLPTWTAAVFLAGIVFNLLVGIVPVPELLQTLGSLMRNAGLIGMGVALWRNGAATWPRSI